MKLISTKILKGTIEVITGLHIGGAKNTMDIGGLDSPVIKTPQGVPYIPGSSLKGKLRTLLALKEGATSFHNESVLLRQMFGYTGYKEPNDDKENSTTKNKLQNTDMTPQMSRLIFRDAYLDEEHFKSKFKDANLETEYTEAKYENTIDRTTGTVSGPGARQVERVPVGAKFKFEIVVNQFQEDNIDVMINKLKEGIQLLEQSYLGGSGTRGYGKVKFYIDK
jgi:CRISPR type III-A/MTUBE-associated RAMP protein Csm3